MRRMPALRRGVEHKGTIVSLEGGFNLIVLQADEAAQHQKCGEDQLFSAGRASLCPRVRVSARRSSHMPASS